MHVWIDQDLCTGDGLCTDHCPEVFVLLEDGISYVRDAATGVLTSDPGGRLSMVRVPPKLETDVVDAALDCPGECIFVEDDPLHDLSATASPATTPSRGGPTSGSRRQRLRREPIRRGLTRACRTRTVAGTHPWRAGCRGA